MKTGFLFPGVDFGKLKLPDFQDSIPPGFSPTPLAAAFQSVYTAGSSSVPQPPGLNVWTSEVSM